jgi:hypothetical protein
VSDPLVGPPSPIGEYVKFDALCPHHGGETEMRTEIGEMGLGEKVLATCPECGHQVWLRVYRVRVGPQPGAES